MKFAVWIVCASTLLGIFLPYISEKLVAYKCKQLNEEVPALPNGLWRAACIISPLVCAAGAALALRADGSPASLETLCTLLLWIPFAYVDQRIRIIPNELTLLYLLSAIVFRAVQWSWTSLLFHALGTALALLLVLLSALIVGKGSVGLGDIKLAAVIGFSVGFPNVIYALLAMSLSIGVVSVIGMLLKRLTLKSRLPYAAFLMLGAFAVKLVELYKFI